MSDYNWFTSGFESFNIYGDNDKILNWLGSLSRRAPLTNTNSFVSEIFQMTSVSIRRDCTRVICWIFWTDGPVVPDSFHPCFHRSKRAGHMGKQRIESCLIQKRLGLPRKDYKASKIALYTAEIVTHLCGLRSPMQERERKRAKEHINPAIPS